MSRHLNAFTVASTQRIDEMRGILFDVYDARFFDLRGDGRRFCAEAAFMQLDSSSLSYCAHEGPVRIDFREDDYIRLQVCTAGTGRTSIGDRVADVAPDKIVCSPAHAAMEFGASLEQFSLRLDCAELERDLTSILGTRPKQRLSFDLSAACDTTPTKRLRQAIMHTASSIDISDDPIPAPLLADMDRAIRLAAIYGMPNNYTYLLHGPATTTAPWQVRRIEEWIDTHWRQSMSIEDLVEISGVSARSIFSTFKKVRGYTPMAYLKKVRLQAARKMLLMAGPGSTVTAVGFACHFSNLSHFANDYRRQFGERPSATLEYARQVAA